MSKNSRHEPGTNSRKHDGASTQKDARASRAADKGAGQSPADDKMMRAWNTISRNRGAEKGKN